MFESYEIIDLDETSVLVIYCLNKSIAVTLIDELDILLPSYEIECDELIDSSYSIKVFF